MAKSKKKQKKVSKKKLRQKSSDSLKKTAVAKNSGQEKSVKRQSASKPQKKTIKKLAASDPLKKETSNTADKHAVAAKSPGILLNDKLVLDKDANQFSYQNTFKKRYGKYTLKVKKPAGILFKIVFVFVGFIIIAFASLFVLFGRDLPDVSQLKDMSFAETTVIYDREGNILYSIFGEENRKYVPLSYISKDAIDATLAIEDKNFYNHMGFDIFGIVRAQMKNLEQEEIKQGASTITQQLAKNVFLSSEKTYERKIKELLLSMQIEWMFTKDEILEMYLNKIPYGTNSFGIEAASETFFGKSAGSLSLAEAVILASLPKAPSYYSPYGQNKKELLGYCKGEKESAKVDDILVSETSEIESADLESPDIDLAADIVADESLIDIDSIEDPLLAAPIVEIPKVIEPVCQSPDDPNYVAGRKDSVLERMQEDGYITEEERLVAWRESFDVKFIDPVHKIEAPHFVFYVREYLEQKYGKEMVESGGLEVVTTLDPKMQSLGEDVIAEYAPTNKSKYGANNDALVALDPKTGQVLAMVGSVNYWDEEIDGQVNVVTSVRQPGSSFKPLVYAAAIQYGGIGSGTMLGDYKTKFNNNYVPNNSDGRFKGRMTVRTALASSRNIPAIKAFYIAGEEEKILDFMDSLGVTSLRNFKNDFNLLSAERGWTFHYGPALAIGSGELPLIELVGGYAALANGGNRMVINPILEVRSRSGEIIEKYEPNGEQVMDPQVAFIINNILSDAAARPAGSWRAGLTIADHIVAAKTGTSNKKIGKVAYPNNLLTIGYTPSIVVGAWAGNTDGSQVYRNAWGLTVAAPMWKSFMTQALKDMPDEPFAEPEGIRWAGREVFPNFEQKTNYEKLFAKEDKEEEEEEEIEYTPENLPESTFVADKNQVAVPDGIPIPGGNPFPDGLPINSTTEPEEAPEPEKTILEPAPAVTTPKPAIEEISEIPPAVTAVEYGF